ncbi:ECF transporter S component [Streptococcus suis]|nr:ECF transporter S component [Streptococcus suis]MCK3874226.1 ECF transporter S component [Streptococcus suis]MCK3898844.1 ECF transporter S component [Streptococcus suis]MCK3915919.1 ECF transporter S component [Streptococcus suis]MCK3968230.1 ECF transporter S component [Streptococcus suis]
MRNKKTQELVLLAILTALSLVLAFVYVPTATGFVTLLDVGVYFTAFYLGKKEGAIVGGLAGLLIDFLLGYPQWAFFYYLSSPSRYLTKNILSSIVKISKLFYFGLKFSVKSAYKTNTLC